VGSRRITAITGFGLGVVGLLLATGTDNLHWFVFWFSVATFGVDMTLPPSWAFCNDIGGAHSGAVSGGMNMVGNVGAALSAILFPFFLNKATGSADSFFILAAGINVVAIVMWLFMNPNRVSDKTLSPAAIRIRFVGLLTVLVAVTAGALGYNIYTSVRAKPASEPNQVAPAEVNDVNQTTVQ
jgi:ACS family glucarate transporter-like MFS transporter